jgi:predicted O-methyltransferase YrrM
MTTGPVDGEFRAQDWDAYKMATRDPFVELEPLAAEIAVVDDALAALVAAGMLPHDSYYRERFAAHRAAVRITPRQERLIWALAAITQPARMVAAGVFCGFTFICNAGAAVGAGATYQAEDLVGVEIKAEEAERAERNVRLIDPTGVAHVIAEDAVEVVAGYPGTIDLLYLDANGDRGRGKGIYLEILEAGYDRLAPGALVLAHNSVNAAEKLADYLQFVRDPAHMAASLNVILDPEGLEVSAR